MPAPRIFSVEDDRRFVSLLQRHFKCKGWPFAACAGDDLFLRLNDFRPEVLLLDWSLESHDGLEILKAIKDSEFQYLPVIMVTGQDSENCKCKGLEAGADDYLTKPFSLTLLDASIASVLRRLSGSLSKYDDGDLQIDLVRGFATLRRKPLAIGQQEWRILAGLVRSPYGLSRQELVEVAWANKPSPSTAALEKMVSRVKHALCDESVPQHSYIVAVRGIGYRFVHKRSIKILT